tara:strand:- start:174 stop:623 length:450 start_codon:yes stop_codon:yes gene_type:complete
MKKKLKKKYFFKKIVKKNKFKTIILKKGNLEKIVDKKSKYFNGFGEMYFSNIKKNMIKAWKLHKKNTSLIFVVSGKVKFVFYYKNFFYEIVLNKNKSNLLQIPPNIWFGFKGIDSNNVVCNFMNNLHSDSEVLNKEINEMSFKWKKKII